MPGRCHPERQTSTFRRSPPPSVRPHKKPPLAVPSAFALKASPATTSRRRRLWDLPVQFHCPIIGVCFDIAEIRRTVGKSSHYPGATTDYTWHTLAVGVCENRNPLSEQLHRILERRYALTIRQTSTFKSAGELRDAWSQACQMGADIPSMLWAVSTHSACDYDLEQIVLADIHMIQHQVGAGIRHDVQAMDKLKRENEKLRSELESTRIRTEQLRKDQATSSQALQQQISGLQIELAARTENMARLQSRMDQFHASLPDISQRGNLLARLAESENRIRTMRENEKRLESELGRLRDFAAHVERTIEALTANDEAQFQNPPSINNAHESLNGKCVLCVGGRSGAIHFYRDSIERHGGRFVHHDGGREENLHRIESVIAAADAVICQVACISHNAYWRVKEQCKRTGKPCLFVKREGSSSFERAINQLFTAKENRHGQ